VNPCFHYFPVLGQQDDSFVVSHFAVFDESPQQDLPDAEVHWFAGCFLSRTILTATIEIAARRIRIDRYFTQFGFFLGVQHPSSQPQSGVDFVLFSMG